MPKKKPSDARGKLIVVLAFALLGAALLVVFVIVPRVVAAKIEAAASKRALTIQYGSAAYRFTHAEVRDVTIFPAGSSGSKRVILRAPTVDARIFGLSPTWIILPRVDATVSGPIDGVLQALEPVRKADAALPAEERLPIDVAGGTFTWTSPFGSGTRFSFGEMSATVRPAESLLAAHLAKGKLTVSALELEGVTVDLKRSTKSGEKVDLRASLAGASGEGDEGHATLEAHKKGGAIALDVDVVHFALSQASAEVPGLDFSKAIADVALHAERDEDGAVASNGKLAFTKVRLPPIKVGPVSVAVGGAVKLTWKGTPKKGAPGTMVLDEGKAEVVLGGRARTAKIGGEIAFGADGEGPYLVKLEWSAGPFSCAELAGDAGGALAKGLAQNLVGGSVRARGTIKGDLADVASLRPTLEILEACTVDVGKGIGGVLDALPF